MGTNTISIIICVIVAIIALLLCTKRGRRFLYRIGDGVGDLASGFGDTVD